MEDLSHYRKSYEKSELLESNIPEDPINLFNRWFHEVEDFGGNEEVNAMTVATIGLDGFPRSRVVLLKKFTEEGFIFYTNYNSEKGKAIAQNPKICLSFFWHTMERQVIIKGIASKTSEITSNNYFESRPDGSKLGAIVSNQSEVVPSRAFLEENLKQLEIDYEGIVIPRPEHWGGFLVTPVEVEFWQGRPNRLHDRIRYTSQEDFDWKIERLSP
ncbi:pyridoxamine 5'-phosphate oxidase [Flavobacterium xinjiangense]|uniref:Pyridoxine/pyridoxamine 5'-phosphate oxidase n=1 Tax=Flavobacterium xinjiangense TaxID=178356 RepID=A0A1M7GM82_9FLAO|nr:pyridoxamine 5'-phosphate oxidase [Flavobacterium xinjiangense]SHM17502.1 Pyridoxamine 5'-phosphate oxidase [Flavobacterium xinjiangense]